ncbi:MAG: hypothetical protein Q7S15_02245 [bacterium]|nr:hypothetical protein [bacterium]
MREKADISDITAAFMVGTALVYDGVQFLLTFIPVLGWLISSIIGLWAWMHFFTWFKIRGVSFGSSKRTLTMGGSLVAEVLPILNALPAWTFAVVMILISVKGERLLKHALPKK